MMDGRVGSVPAHCAVLFGSSSRILFCGEGPLNAVLDVDLMSSVEGRSA